MNARSDRYTARVDPARGITAGQDRPRETNAPESMNPGGRVEAPVTERNRRLSQDELRRLASELSDRDRAVLLSVDSFGFLMSKHIETFHFTNHATTDSAARVSRRVLAQLRERRLLEPIERRIGGLRAGSASYVWRLGPVGDRVLRISDPTAPRARRKEPALRFLDHRLAVADVVCDLVLSSRAGNFELLTADPEPASWRTFSGGYGEREVLKPDLFVITAESEFEDHWFVEVDRGTESLPTVLKQCQQYERYRATGSEQATAGLFPRVLWLVPDEHREQQLRAAIAKRPDLDENLFRVARQSALLNAINNQKGGDHA